MNPYKFGLPERIVLASTLVTLIGLAITSTGVIITTHGNSVGSEVYRLLEYAGYLMFASVIGAYLGRPLVAIGITKYRGDSA